MSYAPTLPYPAKCETFQSGVLLHELKVGTLLSQTAHTSVFNCEDDKLILVYHAGREPNRTLREKLATCQSEHQCNIIKSGKAAGHEYDIVQKYRKKTTDWTKLTLSEKRKFIVEDLQAINELHNWGFCHLDIKPEHLLYDSHGTVRLIDYGTAMPTQGTRTGMQFQCTPRYAAPEISGGGYSTASDVYSYGVVLREREASRRSATDDTLRTMIVRMTSRNPEQRPCISEMIAALTQPQQRIVLAPVIDLNEMDRIVKARRLRQRELKEQFVREMVAIAGRAEPMLAARHFQNFRGALDNADRLEAFIGILKTLPRAATETNVTNITANNIHTALSSSIITDLPTKPHRADIETPEAFLPVGSMYIFRRDELTQWQRAQRELKQKRVKRIWNTIGAIVLGIIVIAALPYLIALALVVLVIAALINLL